MQCLLEIGNSSNNLCVSFKSGRAIETILQNLDKLLVVLNNSTEASLHKPNQRNIIQLLEPSSAASDKHHISNDVTALDFSKVSQLDKLNEIICLASSINTYLRTINNRFYKNDNINLIPAEIYSNVNYWLSRLFRFHNTNSVFHQHDYDAIVYMAKLLMQIKYDKLNADGYKAYENSEPVFYVSAASKFAKIEYRKKICTLVSTTVRCWV